MTRSNLDNLVQETLKSRSRGTKIRVKALRRVRKNFTAAQSRYHKVKNPGEMCLNPYKDSKSISKRIKGPVSDPIFYNPSLSAKELIADLNNEHLKYDTDDKDFKFKAYYIDVGVNKEIDQANQRSIVEVHPVLHKDECISTEITQVPGTAKVDGTPINGNQVAPFFDLGFPNCPDSSLAKELNILLTRNSQAGVSIFPSRKCTSRGINRKKHPNILFLQFVFYISVHSLGSNPQIQGGRQGKAKKFKDLGITRYILLKLIEYFKVLMSEEPPTEVSWTLQGIKLMFFNPLALVFKEQVLNPENKTPWQNLCEALAAEFAAFKEEIQAQLRGEPKKNEYTVAFLQLIVSRTKRNFLDFQSLFDPHPFIEQRLRLVLEQLFEIRDADEILVDEPPEGRQEELNDFIKLITEIAEQNKADAENFYPEYKETWKEMHQIYAQCKARFDLARQEVDNIISRKEVEFRNQYGTSITEEQREIFKQEAEKEIVSDVKERYSLTNKKQFLLDPDKFDNDYAIAYSDERMESLDPINVLEPTPFLHFN